MLVLSTTIHTYLAIYESEKSVRTWVIQAFKTYRRRTIFCNLQSNDDNIHRVEQNTWGCENVWLGAGSWMVAGRLLSRINHSCMPNTVVSDVCVDDNTGDERPLGAMQLIASRNIKGDEKLIAEYLKDDDFWLQPRLTRGTSLQTHCGFICTCIACSDGYFKTAEYGFFNRRNLCDRIKIPLPGPYRGQWKAYALKIDDLDHYAAQIVNLRYANDRLVEVLVRRKPC